jgi:hypothetical protein
VAPPPATVVAAAAVGGAGRRSWRRPVGVPRVALEGDARVTFYPIAINRRFNQK